MKRKISYEEATYKGKQMDALKELSNKCKSSVHVIVNGHKSNYESIEEFVRYRDLDDDEIKKDVYDEMIKTDFCVEVQFYPDTPIGFYIVYHYDIELALKEALRICEEL